MIGICGASGYIGWELYNFLLCKGEKVIGTYYKNQRAGLVRFDVMNDNFSIFDKCSYVIIASAYAKIKFCEDNPIEAFLLNVFSTTRLLDYLHQRNIPSLFISSDMAVKNNTKYGRYKAYVEKFIKQKGLRSRYIRPSRINKNNIIQLCEEIYSDFKLRVRKETY